ACRAILYERKPKGNVMPVIEPNGVALPTISREDEERCEELLQRWMAALNTYDADGMKSVMRFPHVRLAENRLAIYQVDDNPMDLFTRLRQQHSWHHSAWNKIKLVQSSPTKAHYAVQALPRGWIGAQRVRFSLHIHLRRRRLEAPRPLE